MNIISFQIQNLIILDQLKILKGYHRKSDMTLYEWRATGSLASFKIPKIVSYVNIINERKS